MRRLEPKELVQRLRARPPFSDLDEVLLRELHPELEHVSLEAGDVLMRRGEVADRLFVLLDGALAVAGPDDRLDSAGDFAELGPGSLVGEVAMLAGGTRSATVVAVRRSELAAIDAAAFRALLDRTPGTGERFLGQARERLRRSQLAGYLAQTFDLVDRAVLSDLESELQWLTLRGGEVLFRAGDPPDGAFIVMTGRLRVTVEEEGRERLLNELGRGEIVGEMALLSDLPRSATVRAARDTDLARFSNEGFQRLIGQHPVILRRVSGFLVERLRLQSERRAPRSPTLITLAVVSLDPREPASEFARGLTRALEAHGESLHVDSDRVDQTLGQARIAQAGEDEPGYIRLAQWLDEQEERHRYVVYETDPGPSRWTERALRQADHVLLVAPATGVASSGLGGIEPPPDTGRSLVLLQAPGASEFTGSAAWLDGVRADDHFHLRRGSAADMSRLARSLIGRGVSLVFGGGGARGFAHLGVLRAFESLGIPVDFVGGTSIGSLIGAGCAMELPADEIQDRCKRYFAKVFDPTLPIVSILAGRRIGRRLVEIFGSRNIEDLPIPFFSVSTNLTRATEALHTRGSIARAIRASISLPGVLPPVHDGREVLVDGGLLNNLPIDLMGRMSRGGRVVAVDVSPEVDLAGSPEMETELSGWALLGRRLNPFARRALPVHILNLLLRSSVVASVAADREKHSEAAASLYLRVPVDDLGLFDFQAVEQISERGYESCVEAIGTWWEQASRSPG